MGVIFDQLRLSDDADRLYINLHVNKADYFKDIYLDSITIMTQDKVSETYPDIPTEDYIYRVDLTDKDRKWCDIVLKPEDFLKSWEEEPSAMKFTREDMGKTLFFVYVKVRGVPDACTPCRLDDEITLGVTFDKARLYQKGMDYTRELAKDCTIPVGFTDFILLWSAFRMAIETEHYIDAIKYFNMLFGNDVTDNCGGIKNCGCHG